MEREIANLRDENARALEREAVLIAELARNAAARLDRGAASFGPARRRCRCRRREDAAIEPRHPEAPSGVAKRQQQRVALEWVDKLCVLPASAPFLLGGAAHEAAVAALPDASTTASSLNRRCAAPRISAWRSWPRVRLKPARLFCGAIYRRHLPRRHGGASASL